MKLDASGLYSNLEKLHQGHANLQKYCHVSDTFYMGLTAHSRIVRGFQAEGGAPREKPPDYWLSRMCG